MLSLTLSKLSTTYKNYFCSYALKLPELVFKLLAIPDVVCDLTQMLEMAA
jgi:hypothetical protein